MTKWKPTAYNSVSPYLVCHDAVAVIDFLQQVFEGCLVRRFDGPDGSLTHAEVRIDDSIVMIGGADTAHGATASHVHVYVKDCESVQVRAVRSGARDVQSPTRKTPEDDLRGGFQDPAGNTWWVATQ